MEEEEEEEREEEEGELKESDSSPFNTLLMKLRNLPSLVTRCFQVTLTSTQVGTRGREGGVPSKGVPGIELFIHEAKSIFQLFNWYLRFIPNLARHFHILTFLSYTFIFIVLIPDVERNMLIEY